jgi:uncharacterized membrane protein
MLTSSPPLNKPSFQFLKLAPWLFAGVSLLGFIDASYLTANHYLGVTVKCFLLDGCDKVTASPYALFFGIPVALLGAGYYLSVFLLSVYCLDTGNRRILNWLSWYTVAGLIASIYFVSLQVFVIEYICIYCMLSAASSTGLFILGMLTLRSMTRANSN